MQTARIWLSDFAVGNPAGNSLEMASVCRKSLPAGQSVRQFVQRDASLDSILLATDDLVQRPGDLACVARNVGQSFLVIVEFLQRLHGQEDIVFLETIN